MLDQPRLYTVLTLKSQINKWRGKSLPLPNFEAVSGLLDAGLNKGSIDDRKMLVCTPSSLPRPLTLFSSSPLCRPCLRSPREPSQTRLTARRLPFSTATCLIHLQRISATSTPGVNPTARTTTPRIPISVKRERLMHATCSRRPRCHYASSPTLASSSMHSSGEIISSPTRPETLRFSSDLPHL